MRSLKIMASVTPQAAAVTASAVDDRRVRRQVARQHDARDADQEQRGHAEHPIHEDRRHGFRSGDPIA